MVEKPCSQCWYKGSWETCKYPASELPTGDQYHSRLHMRLDSGIGKCGAEGRWWLRLPPLLLPRLKYWLMSRRRKTEWANAIQSLTDYRQEENIQAGNMAQQAAASSSAAMRGHAPLAGTGGLTPPIQPQPWLTSNPPHP